MNCLIVDDNTMARRALKQMLTDIDFVAVAGEAGDPMEAIGLLGKTPVDLLLLDIEMPKMTGIELLKHISVRPLTILITARADYALEAFELNVVDYIVKPVQSDRLVKALIRAKEIYDSRNQTLESLDKDFIFVREKNVLLKILVPDIQYIQALGDYLIIYAGDKKHTVHLTLKSFLERFQSSRFMRVHRSYIIALDKIDRVEENTLYIGRQPVPVGENYRQELLRRINLL